MAEAPPRDASLIRCLIRAAEAIVKKRVFALSRKERNDRGHLRAMAKRG